MSERLETSWTVVSRQLPGPDIIVAAKNKKKNKTCFNSKKTWLLAGNDQQAEQVKHIHTYTQIQEQNACLSWMEAKASEYALTGATHGYTDNRDRKVVG